MARKPENDKQSKKPAGRDARLAAALRENLRRRKAQERGRAVKAESAPKRAPEPLNDDKR